MTVITHNRRRSRLSTLIDQPGGVSVGTALKQARANLAEYEPRSREVIEAQVSALAGMKPPSSPDEASAALDQAYARSSAVIDAAPEDQAFDWRIVTVHAQALRLLLTLPSEADDARAQVLDSLKDVLKAKVPGAKD